VSPAPKRAVTHSHIAVRGEHYGAGPSTAARTHGHRSARRAPRCLPSNLRCGGGHQQTARNPHGSRQSAVHGGSSAGYHADGAEPAGRGSRRTHGHRSARRAPRCRPSNLRCGGGNQQTARNPHGSRQSAEHGRSSAGYHADGAEPSGRGSRLSTAEAVRGTVQRHVQENANGVTNPPTREGHTIGRRQICAQPRGTVARTTEMIAEIHYLGVYLGEFWRSAQGTRCNRGSVGPNYRVCPYSIVRC
jgi:hypothetical protein